MEKSSKAKCEAFAARYFLTITVERFSRHQIWYSVDLPTGLITDTGQTGLGGEDDIGDHPMAEIWGAIMEDMKTLTSEQWCLDT